MTTIRHVRMFLSLALSAALLADAAHAAATCPEEQSTSQAPTNLQLCADLEADVRTPSKFRLDVYEGKLNQYLFAMCHRNSKAGWVRDKRIRDAGPWIGSFRDGKWSGKYYGTHVPVLIWYSPEMHEWLKANRPTPDSVATSAVPDGAMMIKEMYSTPAAACAGADIDKLLATKYSSAVMIRDSRGSYDGWFWGWYGWAGSGWKVDWPAPSSSPYPAMGFGQYCTNCHASARDNSTFSTLKNIEGYPGEPLVFLSQNFFLDPSWQSLQDRIQSAGAKDAAESGKDPEYNAAFTRVFTALGGLPQRTKTMEMKPETYDSVWSKPGEPTAHGQFLTSDQCLGCHSAGGTGLQYDMTQPGPEGKLINISPYGTWRGSPMGLASAIRSSLRSLRARPARSIRRRRTRPRSRIRAWAVTAFSASASTRSTPNRRPAPANRLSARPSTRSRIRRTAIR